MAILNLRVERAGMAVRRRRQHVLIHHLPLFAPPSLAMEQGFTFGPPCHGVFKYFIPSLMAVVALKFDSKNIDPFETHPVNMWAFVISTCIYFPIFGILKDLQNSCANYNQILGHVILLSGTLSSVSLVSVILPTQLGRLIFIIWALLPIFLVCRSLKHIYRCLIHGIKNVCSYLYEKVKKFVDRIWALLPIFLVCRSLKHIYGCLIHGIKNVYSYLYEKVKKFVERNRLQEQPLPK